MGHRPGETFDRYTLESVLGAGGMGVVYCAVDSKLRRRVALKVLRLDAASGSDGSDGRARLLREARAAAALDHANAVSVYDVGEVDGEPFIAMELVHGKSLRAFVGDESVSVDTRVRWLADAARALAAAHKRGLVHRDVKPENVMVREEDGAIKVLDFGLAKPTIASSDVDSGLATVTQQGVVVGTPLYMAPEQLRGDSLDGRADQFAWGVMAYELLAGVSPWRKMGQGVSLALEILSSEPAPLVQVAPRVGRVVADVVTRALAKSADARFASMDEIAQALDVERQSSRQAGLAATEYASAPVVAPETVRRAWPRRWRVLVPAALVTCAIAVAGVVQYRAGPRPTISIEPKVVAPAPPSATTLADLPLPRSMVPAALAAYSDGLQAARDGNIRAAITSYTRALELDPSLAASRVRLLMLIGQTAPIEGRALFQAAMASRGNLDERDRRLLDVLEPFVARDTPDYDELGVRAAKLAADYPNDVEVVQELLSVQMVRGELRAALATAEREAALDPALVSPRGVVGLLRAYVGDLAGADSALDDCLARMPRAFICLVYRRQLSEQRGACANIADDARHIIAIDPGDATGYAMLARAMADLDRERSAIEETLRQAWSRAPAARADAMRLGDSMRVAVLFGDFVEAARLGDELTKSLASNGDETTHATAERFRVELALETGQTSAGAKLARDFLGRHEAWARTPFAEDISLSEDAVPEMLAAACDGGAMSADACDRARGAWLADWRARLQGDYAGYLWLHGHAAPARTAAQAREALAARAEAGILPPFYPFTLADADIGRVTWLAGDAAGAIPALRRGAAVCRAFDDPFGHLHAELTLGLALEQSGDAAGACAVYERVSTRWGAAKPASVTADAARKRSSALRCRSAKP